MRNWSTGVREQTMSHLFPFNVSMKIMLNALKTPILFCFRLFSFPSQKDSKIERVLNWLSSCFYAGKFLFRRLEVAGRCFSYYCDKRSKMLWCSTTSTSVNTYPASASGTLPWSAFQSNSGPREPSIEQLFGGEDVDMRIQSPGRGDVDMREEPFSHNLVVGICGVFGGASSAAVYPDGHWQQACTGEDT